MLSVGFWLQAQTLALLTVKEPVDHTSCSAQDLRCCLAHFTACQCLAVEFQSLCVVELFIFSLTVTEIYWELMRLRSQMALARLGMETTVKVQRSSGHS